MIPTRSRIIPLLINGQKLWLAVAEDAGQKELAGEALQARRPFERLVVNISTKFARLEPHNIEKGIIDALKMLGEFLQAGHCYICLLCEKSRKIKKIYEWCGPGVDPKLCPSLRGSVDFPPWQSNPQPASKKNLLFSSEIRQGRSESEQGPEEKEKPPNLLVPIFTENLRSRSWVLMGWVMENHGQRKRSLSSGQPVKSWSMHGNGNESRRSFGKLGRSIEALWKI